MKITHEGPEGDREWMLIDEAGKFISQRTLPKLSTVNAVFEPASLTLAFEKMFFKIGRKSSFSREVKVQVWNDSLTASLEPDLYSQALSQYLGVNVRLVRYAPFSQRRVLSTQKEWKPEVRFADGRPILLTNTKSLEDLNSKLLFPVPMNRFRPNIVIQGEKPFEDDQWKRIKIGEVIFSQPKLSARCHIINIDQQTGQSHGADPLRTLATYRLDGNKVNFGTLWIPENEGLLSLNDAVEVLS
ncbi:MOSC domain-containing protein [Bdellovibrio sp. SKB1291214]|uniref:MOSC domain-containing protein n=1 Tax=Bdellovibrio sp. SKB1291214 TaxID=1732569 RepID=UPI002240A330|nr:MOSC domain-containing protein [Bdellovibrio sp. SKB1291214]UYL07705.1 MOSC domain-containing protein [Bdellovibrio sp. SKB1291214]